MKNLFSILFLFFAVSLTAQTQTFNTQVKFKNVPQGTKSDSIAVLGSDGLLKYIKSSDLVSKPNLNDVTIVGNTSEREIRITDGYSLTTAITQTGLVINSLNDSKIMQLQKDKLSFSDTNNSLLQTNLMQGLGGSTGVRNIEMPLVSGRLALLSDIPSQTIPSLAQVTANGNITTDVINANGGIYTNSTFKTDYGLENYFEVSNYGGGSPFLLQKYESSDFGIRGTFFNNVEEGFQFDIANLSNSENTSFVANLQGLNITVNDQDNDRYSSLRLDSQGVYTEGLFYAKSGIFIPIYQTISSNDDVKISSNDGVGVFTVSSDAVSFNGENIPTKKYRSYVALLTRTGSTAPVATVLENDINGNITFDINDNGYYTVNNDEGAFTANKTIIFNGNATSQISNVLVETSSGWGSEEQLFITTKKTGSAGTEDVDFDKLAFEIRVYN